MRMPNIINPISASISVAINLNSLLVLGCKLRLQPCHVANVTFEGAVKLFTLFLRQSAERSEGTKKGRNCLIVPNFGSFQSVLTNNAKSARGFSHIALRRSEIFERKSRKSFTTMAASAVKLYLCAKRCAARNEPRTALRQGASAPKKIPRRQSPTGESRPTGRNKGMPACGQGSTRPAEALAPLAARLRASSIMSIVLLVSCVHNPSCLQNCGGLITDDNELLPPLVQANTTKVEN